MMLPLAYHPTTLAQAITPIRSNPGKVRGNWWFTVFFKSYFNSDIFSSPLSEPNLSVSAASNFSNHLNLAGNRSLNQQRQSRPGTRTLLDHVDDRPALKRKFGILSSCHVFLLPEIFALFVSGKNLNKLNDKCREIVFGKAEIQISTQCNCKLQASYISMCSVKDIWEIDSSTTLQSLQQWRVEWRLDGSKLAA